MEERDNLVYEEEIHTERYRLRENMERYNG